MRVCGVDNHIETFLQENVIIGNLKDDSILDLETVLLGHRLDLVSVIVRYLFDLVLDRLLVSLWISSLEFTLHTGFDQHSATVNLDIPLIAFKGHTLFEAVWFVYHIIDLALDGSQHVSSYVGTNLFDLSAWHASSSTT